MKLNKSKKAFLLISTYIIFLFVPKIKSNKKDINYNSEYTYHSIEPYASYSNGNVYIADKDTIDIIFNDSDDIYIIDARDNENSDISIRNSYKITSYQEKSEIIDILLKYEHSFPSTWDRTDISMLNEWDIHNLFYYFGIDRDSTENVDFDNSDQEKYNSRILKFFLNN